MAYRTKIKELIFKFFRVFFPLWLFFISFLYFIQPGFYTVDELMLFDEIKSGNTAYWSYWYHILTSTFYKLVYNVIPSKFAITFIFVTITCLLISYIYLNFNRKFYYLSLLLFITPPFISAVMCPSRMSFYSFLILLFMVLTFIKYNSENKISYKNSIIGGILVTLLITYRGEGIVFLFMLPIALYILFKDKINMKKTTVFIITCILSASIIVYNQQKGEVDEKYKMVPFSYEFDRMMREYDDLNITNEELAYIEKYINISDIKNYNYNADMEAEQLFSNKYFLKFYLNLCIKNIRPILKSRYRLFTSSTNWHGDLEKELTGTYIRKNLICKIQYVNGACNKYNSKAIHYFDFFYNPKFILLLMFIIGTYSVITRNLFYIMLAIWQILYFILVFLSAPVAYYDYYLPIYLCSMYFTLLIPNQINNLNKLLKR